MRFCCCLLAAAATSMLVEVDGSALTPSLHSAEHHSPHSPCRVQRTEPSSRPHLSQASVTQTLRSRKSFWLCSLVSFMRHTPHECSVYVYRNCTRLGRCERCERQERHAKSVSCVLSVHLRGSIPTRASKKLPNRGSIADELLHETCGAASSFRPREV